MTDIREYSKLEPLSDFAERKGVDPGNCRTFWGKGKRNHLDKNEDALKIGRDWAVLSR